MLDMTWHCFVNDLGDPAYLVLNPMLMFIFNQFLNTDQENSFQNNQLRCFIASHKKERMKLSSLCHILFYSNYSLFSVKRSHGSIKFTHLLILAYPQGRHSKSSVRDYIVFLQHTSGRFLFFSSISGEFAQRTKSNSLNVVPPQIQLCEEISDLDIR